jgi:hypothetical protein
MKTRFSILAGALLLLLGASHAAHGQSTRTWVSVQGDDEKDCSRAAPCRTFFEAISKTAAGGEIRALGSGAFGAVTITKSISIVAEEAEGGILASGVNGIIVNAAAGDIVSLRGLLVEGAATGLNGIRFLAGGALHVEKCVIRGFRAGSAGDGHGIAFLPNGASELFVTNTLVSDNGGGILIKPSGTGSAKVTLDRVKMVSNTFGFKADGSAATGAAGILAEIHYSRAAGNSSSGIAAVGGTQSVNVLLDHTASVDNGSTGVNVSATADTIIRISNTTVTGNAGAGLSFTPPGQIISLGTNKVGGNNPDGAPSSAPGPTDAR